MFVEKVDCDVEFRIVKPDGTVKHIHGMAHPVLSPNGELVEVVGTMVDITERKRAEELAPERELPCTSTATGSHGQLGIGRFLKERAVSVGGMVSHIRL